MSDFVRAPSGRGMSVKDDWRAWLPEEKEQFFRSYVKELEVSYTMLSVALNEAIELRLDGRLEMAYEAVYVTPDLCERLAQPLAALLWSLSEHARHYGTVPNATPLDPANFLGARCQRVARISGLLSRVLLSQRAQFLYKISTLGEIVEDLNLDYRSAASELSDGTSAEPGAEWQAVDAVHYDLNTCMREAIVLLKSFLRALPDDQLGVFQATVRTQLSACGAKKTLRLGHRLNHNRRMTPIGGE